VWVDDDEGEFVSVGSFGDQGIAPSSRSNNSPSPPIRQESAHSVNGAPEGFQDDVEREFMSDKPIIPSSPRSKYPPSPPVRKESIPRAPEWSWNVDEMGGDESDLEEGDIELVFAE
jgi:hypothetical protein